MLNTHRRVRVSRLKEEARAQDSPAVACALTQPKNHHIRIYLTSFVVNTDVTVGTMSAEDAPTTPFASPRLLDASTPPLSRQPPLNASASPLMLQNAASPQSSLVSRLSAKKRLSKSDNRSVLIAPQAVCLKSRRLDSS